jgi:hypothetical protein
MQLGNGLGAGLAAPVSINLGGYYSQEPPAAVNGEPPKGESVIYKIPPAVWILVFLLVGYLGMRFVMED